MPAFLPPAFPGGRIPLVWCTLTVGAVFPPCGDPPGPWAWRLFSFGDPPGPWEWRLFSFGDQPARSGHCKTETAARAAVLAAWTATLQRLMRTACIQPEQADTE